MKTRILRIIFLTLIVSGVFYFNGGIDKLLNPQTVKAFGDLLVDFRVSIGKPIFKVHNMKPGDSETRPIDVTNSGTVARYISTKGFKNGGVGNAPLIESALMVDIKDGGTLVYGPKTLASFITDSADPNGIPLGIVNSGGHKTYDFNVNFPASADNNFQAKSVTVDLTFGTITSNTLVINEVYYNVDNQHGLNAPKEKDEIEEEKDDRKNGKKDRNKKPTRYKFQWIELYNPTNKEISLKNWKLVNNSGTIIINSNKSIKPGDFVLISKDSSVWRFWKNHQRGEKIVTGKKFGDGLDVAGDHLYLTDPKGKIVDKTSWGSDTSGFTPPGTNPAVITGHSTERLVPAFDTDKFSDWVDRFPPTPGN